jgi:hypothetical protein
MSTVTFKREAQTYDDALKAYNRQLDSYNNKVKNYNGEADAYNKSFVVDAKGNKYAYKPAQSGMRYDTQNPRHEIDYTNGIKVTNTVYDLIPYSDPEKFYVVDRFGNPSPINAPPTKNYGLTDAGNGYQVLRTPVAQGQSYASSPKEPGTFTQKFNMQAPDLTIGQKARLNEPNLSDLERTDSGLIKSAFNY